MLWLPSPPIEKYQRSQLWRIESPLPYRLDRDPDFGNEVLLFQSDESLPRDLSIEVIHKITRYERRGFERKVVDRTFSSSDVSSLYLEPRGLVVLDERVREIARDATQSLEDPLDIAKALYDYVVGHMAYDKSGEGWGNGDVVYACQVGKGNCTDFHSLFIALARSRNIPARFKIGIPIPKEEGKSLIPYHCWAEFYLQGRGWIPVDISEAWKRPEKADYFFGNLDEDRILLSMGREIQLPGQKGPPLNYFIYPYVELGGEPYKGLEFDRTYEVIQGG